jgi:hypothetical protein
MAEAMTPDQVHSINMLIAMIIIGLPLAVVFGGPFLWRGFVIIAGLGLLGLHPPLGFLFFVLIALWRPIKLLAGFLIGGYAAGLGFGRATRPRYPRRRPWTTTSLQRHDAEFRRGPPRLRGRRPEDYQPFNDPIDMG